MHSLIRLVAAWAWLWTILAGARGRAATPADHARVKYLVASGQAAQAASESATLWRADPDDLRLLVWHAVAMAALGEGPSIVQGVEPLSGPAAAVVWVAAVAEGLSSPQGYCADIAAMTTVWDSPEHAQALLPVRARLGEVCPDLRLPDVATGGVPERLAGQLHSADVAWGRAVEAWLADEPADLTVAGNLWSEEADGLGLVGARLALAAAADRAATSGDPVRIWWAREVVRWQGRSTGPLDARLARVAPEAREVRWTAGAVARWSVSLPAGAPELLDRMEEVALMTDARARLQQLRALHELIPEKGLLRATWWHHTARCHGELGQARREVLAYEQAWRADPAVLDRANAFAWAAAEHRTRMSDALAALSGVLDAPMPYRADRGGPSADAPFRWNQGHLVGAALDTRAWLRFQMGDLPGARADLDRALMLYRSPSATVHFHAALVAAEDDEAEVAMFHLKEGFAVVDPRHDASELVSAARRLADVLYDGHRWHPDGVEGWLASERIEDTAAGDEMVDLERVAAELQQAPPGLPVQGGMVPPLMLTIADRPTKLEELEGWRVVELWAAWCVNCHVQLGALLDLRAHWQEDGVPVTVVVVSVEEEPRRVWSEQLVGVPAEDWVLAWGGPGLLEQVGAAGLPATLIVSPEGRVVATRIGWEGSVSWIQEVLVEAGVWPLAAEIEAE